MLIIETKPNDDVIKANTFKEAIHQLEKQLKLKLEKQNLSLKHEVKNCKHYNSCNKVSKPNRYFIIILYNNKI